MTFDVGSIGLSEILAAVALAGTVYNYVSKPGTQAQASVTALAKVVEGKAEKPEVGKVAEKVEHLEERLAVVESEVSHLPDKDSSHRMELAIARLEGRLETVVERLKPVAEIASRLQEVLLEKAK